MLRKSPDGSDGAIIECLAADGLRKLAAHPTIREKFSADEELKTLLWTPASRYVLGTKAAEVMPKTRQLANKGYRIGLEYVGEELTDLKQIQAVVEEYLGLLELAPSGDFGSDLQIGFDLSNVGLLVSRDLALRNTARITSEAAKHGCSVVISMERSVFTEAILDLFIELAPVHPNLGITVQAQLNRTSADLDALLRMGRKIRLVKGVYSEHSAISLPRGDQLDNRYISLALRLADGGVPFALATHDAALVQKLKAKGIFGGAGELECLHGCNPNLLKSQLAAGVPCRLSAVYGNEWLLHVLHRLAEHTPNVLEALADYCDPKRVSFGASY